MQKREKLIDSYRSLFGRLPNRHIYSPYRICPLGAHVDHQHGIVTGFAFDKGIDLVYDQTEDGRITLHSQTFPGSVDFILHEKDEIKHGDWGDYVRGAAYALKKRFVLKRGICGVLQGSLPIGGLSSSAAVLVAYVMALADANGIQLTKMEVIKTASQAEREYIGLNNGILDQACIVLGKRDGLLFLDTKTDEYRLLPRPDNMPDFELGVFFSGLTRSLISSDYNLRVNECKTAAWNMLAYTDQPLKKLSETFLRDIPIDTFEKTRERMPSRFTKRAEHFYTEYRRVRQGVTAWETGNLKRFGELCFESCESSIRNYECGSPELIALYEIMRHTEGIYGGRFSGAGFKGACIALVAPAKKAQIEERITREYLARFPEYADSFKIYFCKPDNGARFI